MVEWDTKSFDRLKPTYEVADKEKSAVTKKKKDFNVSSQEWNESEVQGKHVTFSKVHFT